MNESALAKPGSRSATGGRDGWLSRERALAIALLATTAVAIYVCYRIALPFLPALAWALALAVLADPLHERVARRIRHPGAAAAAAVGVVAIVVVAPVLFVSQHLVREAVAGIETLREEIASGRLRDAIEANRWLAPVWSWTEGQFGGQEQAGKAFTEGGARVVKFINGSVWAVIELLVAFLALYYFFRDREPALRAVRNLLPLSPDESNYVFERIRLTLRATVLGTLIVAVIQGVLGGLMFWWLGLPAPLLWGLVMALLAVLPLFGASIIWAPAALFLALQGNWGQALILAAWGGIVVALIDNLIYPMLVGKDLHLHTLPVFIAIVGGLVVFGVSGLILGPLVLAVTLAILDIWHGRTESGGAADDEAALET